MDCWILGVFCRDPEPGQHVFLLCAFGGKFEVLVLYSVEIYTHAFPIHGEAGNEATCAMQNH